MPNKELTHAVFLGLKPFARLDCPQEVIRQFTPNWFAVTMGTGILAIALSQFPVPIPGLRLVAQGLWFLNMGLFSLFTCLYAARWLMFYNQAKRVFGHSVISMFFGCIPMGLATIINGLLIFGIPLWGKGVIEIAEGLWWLDAALSVLCGIAIPFMMFTRQNHSIEQMTGVWLLPFVAAEVAAVSGGLLAPYLMDAHQQLNMIITSFALWAFSVPIAMGILVILLMRMVVHKLPPANMAATSWLALGPIGTGALGLLILGSATPEIFNANGLGAYGSSVQGIGLVGGILLWGYGLWWVAIASVITLRYLLQGLPFNLGWWGYTFPIGVYCVATLRLATMLPMPIFSFLGGGMVIILAGLWLIVGTRTVLGAWRGDLFVSPCLKEL